MLVDATTGQTLALANADKPVSPASLTKLMTAYLTFSALRERRIRFDQTVASPPEAEIPQGARMFLLPGKSVSISELLQGMITLGAHDAAIALANAIAGSEAAFVESMNKTAQRLGLQQTRFMNSTGVTHPEHRTTVADLVKLTIALVNEFAQIADALGMTVAEFNNIMNVNEGDI